MPTIKPGAVTQFEGERRPSAESPKPPKRPACGSGLLAIIAVFLLLPAAAEAQRSTENVVTAAEDAFGTSIGRDTIGLYRTNWIRGFSPATAGNVRIDGLYFDQVYSLTQRISTSTTIRVGPSALGFPFSAPTGVIDYQLRRPGDQSTQSAFLSADSYGSLILEADAALPLKANTLSLGFGLGLYRRAFHNGTTSKQVQGAAMLRWRPSSGADVQAFWNTTDNRDDEIGPIYVPSGPSLPPRPPRGRHIGPDWVKDNGRAANYGLVGSLKVSDLASLRIGVFRSLFDNAVNYRNLIVGLGADGVGRQLIIVDPPSRTQSTSGEARWTNEWRGDRTRHEVHLSVRGRVRTRVYGGSDSIDLGSIAVDDRQRAPAPALSFRDQDRDRVEQAQLGLAYQGRWKGVGEFNASIQYSRFGKTTRRGQEAPIAVRSGEMLGSLAGAVQLTRAVSAYGGVARGLEEGGVAPATAVNRNEAAPAVLTRQADVGLRWQITPDVKLIGGAFEVRKPYYTVDRAQVWRRLGHVRNRGVEFSVSGKVARDLTLVGGAVFIDAKVLGDDTEFDGAGRRPVDTAGTTMLLTGDWKVPALDGLSVNAGITHVGRLAATVDNSVELPPRTTVDAGLRYRFELGRSRASVRLQAANLGNVYGYVIRSPGAYSLAGSRVVTLSFALDH